MGKDEANKAPPGTPRGPKVWREAQVAKAQKKRLQKLARQNETPAEAAARVVEKRRASRRSKVSSAFGLNYSKTGPDDVAAILATLDADGDDEAGPALGKKTRNVLASGGYSRIRFGAAMLPLEKLDGMIRGLTALDASVGSGEAGEDDGEEIGSDGLGPALGKKEEEELPVPGFGKGLGMTLPVRSKKEEKTIASSPAK